MYLSKWLHLFLRKTVRRERKKKLKVKKLHGQCRNRVIVVAYESVSCIWARRRREYDAVNRSGRTGYVNRGHSTHASFHDQLHSISTGYNLFCQYQISRNDFRIFAVIFYLSELYLSVDHPITTSEWEFCSTRVHFELKLPSWSSSQALRLLSALLSSCILLHPFHPSKSRSFITPWWV